MLSFQKYLGYWTNIWLMISSWCRSRFVHLCISYFLKLGIKFSLIIYFSAECFLRPIWLGFSSFLFQLIPRTKYGFFFKWKNSETLSKHNLICCKNFQQYTSQKKKKKKCFLKYDFVFYVQIVVPFNLMPWSPLIM